MHARRVAFGVTDSAFAGIAPVQALLGTNRVSGDEGVVGVAGVVGELPPPPPHPASASNAMNASARPADWEVERLALEHRLD